MSSFNPFGPPGQSSGGPVPQPGPARPVQGPSGPPRPQPSGFGPSPAQRGPGNPGAPDAFGSTAAGPGSAGPGVVGSGFESAGPPAGLLFATLALAVVGIVLGGLGWAWSNWLALIGWLVAGPVAIGVLGIFMATDTTRRTAPVYVRPGWVSAANAVAAALIVVGILVGSVGVAMWIGRM